MEHATSVMLLVDREAADADDVAGLARRAYAKRGILVSTHEGLAGSWVPDLKEHRLVVVGDDFSFHQALNELLRVGVGEPRPTVGFIPSRPDTDLCLTFGLPSDPERAAARTILARPYPLDLGRVSAAVPGTATGNESTRYFAFLSEIGFGAARHRRSGPRPSRLGRFLSFWAAYLGSQRAQVELHIDRRRWEGRSHGIVVGNCPFWGGLRLSPRSFPGDGALDVLVAHGPKSMEYRNLPKMFRGEQVPSPDVAEFRAKIGIRIEARPPLPVHADGLVVGTTPARYVVVPQAVWFTG